MFQQLFIVQNEMQEQSLNIHIHIFPQNPLNFEFHQNLPVSNTEILIEPSINSRVHLYLEQSSSGN